MTTVRVDVDKVEVLGDLLGAEEAILTRIGAHMEEVATRAFREQGRPSRSWGPRMTPNVAGIVNSLNAGSEPKQRDLQPSPALISTGHLRRSIKARPVQGNTVEVGTTVPYATLQQEGGPSTITLTPDGRQNLTKFLRRNRTNQSLVENLGWLFQQPTFTVQVRARPFLLVLPSDVEEVEQIVVEELERVA